MFEVEITIEGLADLVKFIKLVQSFGLEEEKIKELVTELNMSTKELVTAEQIVK